MGFALTGKNVRRRLISFCPITIQMWKLYRILKRFTHPTRIYTFAKRQKFRTQKHPEDNGLKNSPVRLHAVFCRHFFEYVHVRVMYEEVNLFQHNNTALKIDLGWLTGPMTRDSPEVHHHRRSKFFTKLLKSKAISIIKYVCCIEKIEYAIWSCYRLFRKIYILFFSTMYRRTF